MTAVCVFFFHILLKCKMFQCPRSCKLLCVHFFSFPQDLSALQCEVCVLVFSVTDRRSFHRTAQLRLLLRETQPQTPIILVGNKSDLVRSREVTAQGAGNLRFPSSPCSLFSPIVFALTPGGGISCYFNSRKH
ncbi:hypothetical protein ILYODFUR_036333 [Ilyodon furcidens]|uniref:Small monomeric GTPase n=1 Tax=Ilyodon furcidens TaxID=33524 RepID=A0ABV0U124_9TELE